MTSSSNKIAVFDIETTGLRHDKDTRMLCAVARVLTGVNDDTGGELRISRTAEEHRELAKFLAQPEVALVGHNIIKFDIPMLAKLTGVTELLDKPMGAKVFDTLICSQLAFPDIWEMTQRGEVKPTLTPKLQMSHGLKAWGQRLGHLKDTFGEEEGAFSELTPELVAYCTQDVDVTLSLFRHLVSLEKRYWSREALALEQRVANIIRRQEDTGVTFDSKAAWALYATVAQEKQDILESLQVLFPPWKQVEKRFVPKVNNARLGYTKGVEVVKYKILEFNPASQDHIALWLNKRHGWVSPEQTPTGKPKVSEEILNEIDVPEAKALVRFTMLNKLVGMLGNAEGSWLRYVGSDGLIRGAVNSVGAATRRMTHSQPNLAQVPNASHPFGKQCRALFGPPKPYEWIVGCDADQLELRGLAHLLAPHDGGKYTQAALSGDKKLGTDIHSMNAKAFGLTGGGARDQAKTVFYAMIYGAGEEKLGRVVTGRWNRDENVAMGRELKQAFLKGMPAFKLLLDAIKSTYDSRGYLVDLNGHPFRLRSTHAALNAINQRLGAIVMKEAQVLLDTTLQQQHRMLPGVDYEFLLTVHDEWQLGARSPEVAAVIADTAKKAIAQVGDNRKLRCPLAGSSAVGKNWADTH